MSIRTEAVVGVIGLAVIMAMAGCTKKEDAPTTPTASAVPAVVHPTETTTVNGKTFSTGGVTPGRPRFQPANGQ